MNLVDAETIDGSFVPRQSAVASVEVDGETVLAGGPAQTFYRLDPVASLVWSCLDGTGTAEEIAGDLAAELGAPAPAVVADVVALTRTLGLLCFLEGVACPDTTGPAREAVATLTSGRYLVEPPSG